MMAQRRQSVVYTGVDIIEIARIQQAMARWGERFLRRVYSPAELDLCGGRVQSLAARWAAKEAVAKLLGEGLRGMGAGSPEKGVAFGEIEVLADPRGRPTVSLTGAALARARALGLQTISLSLSHDRGMAIAFAVALAPGEHQVEEGIDGHPPT